jgi:hypothetical protein
LDEKLPGINIGNSGRTIKVVAYADGVTIFTTRPTDFDIVRGALQQYVKATGARLNPKKSKALASGGWTAPATALGTELCTHTKILGVSFGTSIATSTKKS